MTSSYSSNSSRTFQGPILLPERLYHSSPSPPFTSPRRPSPPVTIRHVSSSPILHNYDVITKKSTFHDVPKRKDQCLCAPATHPGSFKCSMHRNGSYSNDNVISFNVKSEYGGSNAVSLFHRLYVRRKALVNCLKRIGTVDSGLLRRGFAWLVKPPASQLRRREEIFQPRRSRLSVMSKANEELS